MEEGKRDGVKVGEWKNGRVGDGGYMCKPMRKTKYVGLRSEAMPSHV